MNNSKSYAFLVLGAALFTLGYPNVFGFLFPLGPIIGTAILIDILFRAETTKKAITRFLVFNVVITYMSFYWITATLQEFGELPFIVAAFANFFYIFIFSPQLWIFIFVLHFLRKKKVNIFDLKRVNLNGFLFASILTVIEYYIPQQFPVLIGQPWIVLSNSLGLAPIFGLPAFSFFSYLLIFEAVQFKRTKSYSKLHLASIIAFIIINPLTSDYGKAQPTQQLNIRMVQANISNFLKVDSEKGEYASVSQVLKRYEDLSLKPFQYNAQGIDLIIWPETAYPFPIETKTKRSDTVIPSVFQKISNKTKSEILFGGYDHFKDNPNGSYFETEYNSALQLSKSGELKNVYHKQELIPFGETLPLGPLNEWMSTKLENMAFFARGKTPTLFETASGAQFTASICYEILRPEFLRNYLNRIESKPQFMINLTNDSWYGNTTEPEQHLFLARWRSLEFNLPMLRATNTGVSVEIDRFGQEVGRLNYGKTGNFDRIFRFPSSTEKTPFQLYGFLLILALWVPYFIFYLFLIKLKR